MTGGWHICHVVHVIVRGLTDAVDQRRSAQGPMGGARGTGRGVRTVEASIAQRNGVKLEEGWGVVDRSVWDWCQNGWAVPCGPVNGFGLTRVAFSAHVLCLISHSMSCLFLRALLSPGSAVHSVSIIYGLLLGASARLFLYLPVPLHNATFRGGVFFLVRTLDNSITMLTARFSRCSVSGSTEILADGDNTRRLLQLPDSKVSKTILRGSRFPIATFPHSRLLLPFRNDTSRMTLPGMPNSCSRVLFRCVLTMRLGTRLVHDAHQDPLVGQQWTAVDCSGPLPPDVPLSYFPRSLTRVVSSAGCPSLLSEGCQRACTLILARGVLLTLRLPGGA